MDTRKIDFVIFWVDGDDPVHKSKRRFFIDQFALKNENNTEQSTDERRFIQFDELKFCLRSIKKNAPWYNKIFLITDQQVPHFLEADKLFLDRIELIDHQVLFKDDKDYLPCFNSRALATQLYKLDQLSEYYLVGNDDVFLGAPITPDYFFKDDKPVIYVDKLKNNIESLTLYYQGILNAANLLDFDQEFIYRPSHGFLPFDKRRMKSLYSLFPNEFDNNLKHRFRHETQFVVEALYNYYCIQQSNAIIQNTDSMVHFSFELCRKGGGDKLQFLFELIRLGKRKMFCINEYQSLIKQLPELPHILQLFFVEKLESEST